MPIINCAKIGKIQKLTNSFSFPQFDGAIAAGAVTLLLVKLLIVICEKNK